MSNNPLINLDCSNPVSPRVVLTGDLRVDSVTELLDHMKQLVETQSLPTEVLVDCRDVEFLDTAIIQMLLAFATELHRQGIKFVLDSVPSSVQELLDNYGFTPHLCESA